MLVDSHCHLDFPDFAAGLEETVARARQAGVGHMLTIGTLVRNFPEVLAVAERFPEVTCSVGTHPHSAGLERVTAERLCRTGLASARSGHRRGGPRLFLSKVQPRGSAGGFRRHIAAARKTGLPLVIHTRDADEDAAEILREEMAEGAFKAVLHCYTGGRALAEIAIGLGFYVSFSGILTFPKSGELRELAAALPLDRLLVETDAPFLAPHPLRGKRNEPAFVRHTAKVLAQVKGVSEAEVDKVTTANFFTLFSKAKAAVSAAA